ncbi:MAG: hypothetical protein SGJ19_13855, partial [Planctomycetia bacterium]|nr:hypothetical protein [Planctomycetia bacterium]
VTRNATDRSHYARTIQAVRGDFRHAAYACLRARVKRCRVGDILLLIRMMDFVPTVRHHPSQPPSSE